MWRQAAQAAIAALAEHQSAPVEPSDDTPDEFIAEALRLMSWSPNERGLRKMPASITPAVVREHAAANMIWALNTLAHAATLHKLAVAREALAFYAIPSCGGFPDNFAYQALAQIGHADD